MLEKIYNDCEISFKERGLYVLMYMHGPTQFGEMISMVGIEDLPLNQDFIP